MQNKYLSECQSKGVEILSCIAGCVVQVMWELIPSQTAVQQLVDRSSWATVPICYACSDVLETPALTWQKMRPVYLK